jgi:hypothetical protein
MAKGGGGGRSAGRRLLSALERQGGRALEQIKGNWTPKGWVGTYKKGVAKNVASMNAYNKSRAGKTFTQRNNPKALYRTNRAQTAAINKVNAKGWRYYSNRPMAKYKPPKRQKFITL